MLKTGFSSTIYYIEAGPGCGNSYAIHKLASQHDLVEASVTKLKPDYEGIHGDSGDQYSLLFKTTQGT